MVVDATVPSLVLLTLLIGAVLGGHLGAQLVGAVADRRRRQACRRSVRTVVAPARRCPGVVLIDDDRSSLVAA